MFKFIRNIFKPQDRNTRKDTITLYVDNLPLSANKNDLWDMFSKYGRVFRVYVYFDEETGCQTGYATIEMSQDAADSATAAINGTKLDENILRVVKPDSTGILSEKEKKDDDIFNDLLNQLIKAEQRPERIQQCPLCRNKAVFDISGFINNAYKEQYGASLSCFYCKNKIHIDGPGPLPKWLEPKKI